ncbi:MAG: DeoR/GlpR family DNA-binding transcription regulator [Pseudomonadota bacterium]
MRPDDRQKLIANLVRSKGRLTVEALAGELGTSRETIRRDLTALADNGLVRKIHGGAMPPWADTEGPFSQRMLENTAAKQRIAVAAAGLFGAGDTLFIDTGSTTLCLAEALAKRAALTVVTNSSAIAKVLSQADAGHRVYLLGGEFNGDNLETGGELALEQIRAFRANHVVLTIGALEARAGVMDFNIEEAQVARAMIGQSQSVTIIADASKFDRIAAFEVCPLERVARLVCDAPPTGDLARKLAAAGVAVICPPG